MSVQQTPHTVENPLRPLVIDLDGTLIKSDLLIESFLTLVTQSPLKALYALKYLGDRAKFKACLASQAQIDIARLPFNEEVLTWLQAERLKGRCLFLASASSQPYVQAVADHLGLFDGVFASDDIRNLKADIKAGVLCQAFGKGGFDYAGNAAADFSVWAQADKVICINAGRRVQRRFSRLYPEALVLAPRKIAFKDYLRTLRPHQWLKNLLVFVPALTAHVFTSAGIVSSAIGFISFSLCASSAYILNDMFDLSHDRDHSTKRLRPFASGNVDLLHGLVLLFLALITAVTTALLLPEPFLVVLAVYFGVTLAYSLYLKRYILVDVMTLASLYGIRLVAGGAAIGVPLSAWLLSFAGFFFLCLALVKRCAELIEHTQSGKGNPKGRGYLLNDLPFLQMLAAASGYVAVLVFALYIDSSTVAKLYSTPQQLWAIPAILLYWVSRVLFLTHRGVMHEDPILFAAKDKQSLACAGAILAILISSL